ncbi:MAG: gliding motility-associated C-terminal domain-containing protein [Chitinophagales bacterium]
MKKIYLFLLAAFVVVLGRAQQQILLMTETFEGAGNSFVMDSGGVGTNSGSNSWIINNNYTGQPTYPNTPPQDSVVSGQINGAPNSHYLHIHDETNTTVSNANWNTANASDRFTYLGSPFCTLGMTNVIFTFFYVCEGDANTYGEVYYRIDGGPWIKTGQAKYNNQSKWKYEVIQDPAFNNVQNLQLGFRWVNPAAGTTNVSFGIDDIIAVGTYDEVNNPVQVNISGVTPTSVCQGDNIIFFWSLSKPLCDADYFLELSDANGNNFAGINQFIHINAPDTTGAFLWTVPNNIIGNCFKMRLHRAGQPDIVGSASVCFSVSDCPETVITQNAPVMTDVDTACVLSVIDVKFNSYGVFLTNNAYIAELSDASGSFANPYFLGSLPSNQSFPAQPGNVSGLIPQSVPAGCGYYIRVRATSPATTGTLIGPFCLVHCDELTNNHTDLHFCIGSPSDSICHQFNIKPNNWTNQADYDTCNKWTIELRSMMDFSLVNSGGLGVYHDSIGGNFTICMPSVRDSLPMAPGAYYMRIVSNCSNQAWNQTGSVIRLTVGAPDTIPPDILMDDTVTCNQGQIAFTVDPFKHPPSDYIWSSNFLGNPTGTPFEWPIPTLTVNITPGTLIGDYVIYVRERNFGCFGPYSDAGRFTLITSPAVHIAGDTLVCLGDTVTYDVTYLKETYYNWDGPPGVTILDESNSQVTMIFDSLGDFNISNFSLNACGSDSGNYKVHVVTLYHADAGADKSLCVGDSVQLHVETDPVNKYLLSQDTAKANNKQGGMFDIRAHSDVVIDSFAVKFNLVANTQVEVYNRQGSYRTHEQDQFSWNQVGAYFGFTPNPVGQMTVLPVAVNQPIAAGDTMGFYVTTSNQAPNPIVKMSYGSDPAFPFPGAVYKTDGIIDFVIGTANDYPFSTFAGPRILNCKVYYHTKAGQYFIWNTGDTTATIMVAPTQSTLYNVMVYDTSGCRSLDTVFVKANPLPVVNAGPDTLICDGEVYTMQATSTVGNVNWNPGTGLNSTSILNPTFTNSEGIEFVLYVLDDTSGCRSSDTVKIDVHNCAAYIEVPQAFTPNGDGVNDHFTLFGNNIADYEIRIYNRWGELVYSTRDLSELNDMSKGWDGTYKGKEQNLGTFVFYLTAKDVYGKNYEKKGNLTLIR